MGNNDKPLFDDQCWHAFGLKQEAHLRWTRDRSKVKWEEFVHCQVSATETYKEANSQFSDRNRNVLMNVHSLHMWWYTLKSVVFGSSSSLPPLVSEGSGVVYESVGIRLICCRVILTASSAGRLLICRTLAIRPLYSLTTIAFRSSEVRRPLLDLDPSGDTDSLGLFPLFLKRTADVMAPVLV